MTLLKKYLPDSIIFVLLLILAYKVIHLSENVIDINNFDESVYLFRGVNLTPFLKSHLDGFFYYLWYHFLSLFTISNIELFYLNYKILLVLPGILLYIFLRVMRSNIFIAYIAASIFILSYANVYVFPLITKFALCVILSGLIVISFIEGPAKKLIASVILSAVLLYIRPEFLVTLILTSLITILYSLREARATKNKRSLRMILPVILIFVIISLLNPVSRQRVNEAYSQQYSFEISQRDNHSDKNYDIPVSQNDWIDNSFLFAEHAGYNVIAACRNFIEIFPYFIIKDDHNSYDAILYPVVFLMFLSSSIFLFQRIKRKQFRSLSFIFFSFTLPPVLSVLIFYPRLHYLIFIFAFLLIYLSYEVSLRINSGYITGNKYLAAAAVTCILIVLFVPLRVESGSIHESNCTMLKTVNFLYELDSKVEKRVIFFAAHPGYRTYLESNWKFAEKSTYDEGFIDFVSRNNINLILADDYITFHLLLKTDPKTLETLLDSGFVRIEIPGCNSFLIARIELLNQNLVF